MDRRAGASRNGEFIGIRGYEWTVVHVAQTNNSYIFPGLALGILASRARHVSDAMIMASAKALAGQSPGAKIETHLCSPRSQTPEK